MGLANVGLVILTCGQPAGMLTTFFYLMAFIRLFHLCTAFLRGYQQLSEECGLRFSRRCLHRALSAHILNNFLRFAYSFFAARLSRTLLTHGDGGVYLTSDWLKPPTFSR